MQDLLEVRGDEEADLRALLLEHDVGGHGRAVEQARYLPGRLAAPLEDAAHAGQDADRLVLRGGRGLEQRDPPGLVVEEQEIGERAPDVYSKTARHAMGRC